MQTNILWPLTVGLGLALSAPAQVKTEVPAAESVAQVRMVC
jgi:hypothetical protein